MNDVKAPYQVNKVTICAITTASLLHQGCPSTIPQSVKHFISCRMALGLSPLHSRTFNILYSDPSTTPPAKYQLGLCASINKEQDLSESGLTLLTIPAGEYACLRLIGADSQLPAAISYLYGTWLTKNKHIAGDFPPFLERVKFFPDVPEEDRITDIYLPLVS